jgi:hypothetical protein
VQAKAEAPSPVHDREALPPVDAQSSVALAPLAAQSLTALDPGAQAPAAASEVCSRITRGGS